MNIGIGFGFLSEKSSFWNSEPLQNAIFLYILLKKVKGYNVILINFGIDKSLLSKQTKHYLGKIKIIDWKDLIKNKNDIDLFINPNLYISDNIVDFFKKKGIKLIRIDHTNNYNTDINEIYTNPKGIVFKDIYDEIWIYQNNLKNNKTYLETIYNSNVEVMPFIWDPYFIKKQKTLDKKSNFGYVEHEKKNLTIFDSNNNIFDTSIYSLLLLEKIYKSNKELFKEKVDKIRVINSLKFKENLKYLSIINKLDIKKDGFCSFEENYDTFSILANYTDIVVSNQSEDQLKYFYFESLYGNYPLVHNSEFLKSNGYYYNDNKIKEMINNFINFIDNHNNIIDKYKLKFDKIMERYSINSDFLIKKYKNQIEK